MKVVAQRAQAYGQVCAEEKPEARVMDPMTEVEQLKEKFGVEEWKGTVGSEGL